MKDIKLNNLASIQFLRFLAATLVVAYHASLVISQNYEINIAKLLLVIANVGASGVHIFFVISGFIMIYTSFSPGAERFSQGKFFAKRIIRIYPIYLIYSGAYLFFYIALSTGKSLSAFQLLGSIFLLPGYSSYIIGPGWTLSYEVYFYACFGIAMKLGLFKGLSFLTCFFAAAIASRLLFDANQPALHVITNTLLVEFLFGAWVGYAVVSLAHIRNALTNAILASAFAIFVAGILAGYTRFPSVVTWGIPSALLVAGLVFKEKNGLLPMWIKKYSYLGDSSYSLYLIHIVLLDVVILIVKSLKVINIEPIDNLKMIGVCFALVISCIVVAYFLYEFVERPLVSLLQEFYKSYRKTCSSNLTTLCK